MVVEPLVLSPRAATCVPYLPRYLGRYLGSLHSTAVVCCCSARARIGRLPRYPIPAGPNSHCHRLNASPSTLERGGSELGCGINRSSHDPPFQGTVYHSSLRPVVESSVSGLGCSRYSRMLEALGMPRQRTLFVGVYHSNYRAQCYTSSYWTTVKVVHAGSCSITKQ